MYYLYLIQSPFGRSGFGIMAAPYERNKQYCSHMGGIVNMRVYGGLRAHAKALERTIKTQYVDNIWMVGDWGTEWLKDTVPMSQLIEYVEGLIKERHFRLKLITPEWNFQQTLPE
jgi:hypothetical protein